MIERNEGAVSVADRLEVGYFTPKEVCRLLGLSNTLLYQLLKDGRLDSVKLGRARRIPGPSVRRMMEVAAETGRRGG